MSHCGCNERIKWKGSHVLMEYNNTMSGEQSCIKICLGYGSERKP